MVMGAKDSSLLYGANKTLRYSVKLFDEKSTYVICISYGLRKLKKTKLINYHLCKEVIHRVSNADINRIK